jgi:hypothetical protein
MPADGRTELLKTVFGRAGTFCGTFPGQVCQPLWAHYLDCYKAMRSMYHTRFQITNILI